MTKTELEKRIEELEEKTSRIAKQLDELKQVKVKETPRKRWIPEYDEEYYYLDDCGFINVNIWVNDDICNWRYKTNNVFKTGEEVKEHKKKLEIKAQFKNFVEERSEKLDWKNCNQYKYYLYYAYKTKQIYFEYVWTCKDQGTIYASFEQILRDAIAEIGEDNIKKYVLEVEE